MFAIVAIAAVCYISLKLNLYYSEERLANFSKLLKLAEKLAPENTTTTTTQTTILVLRRLSICPPPRLRMNKLASFSVMIPLSTPPSHPSLSFPGHCSN